MYANEKGDARLLKFIFGRAVSGKTTAVFECIKNDVLKGERDVLLIVPEQSNFDCERKLLSTLGDGNFTAVPVLSFTRLCDEVGRQNGGISARRLSDCDRLIFMSRAICAVSSSLNFFSKYKSNTSFLESMLATMDELSRCGIDSAQLRTVAERLGGSLYKKLSDLALIIDSYEALLGNRYSDAAGDMAALERSLSEYAYFAEKTVYIDSFKNFTGAQLKIIEKIIAQADDVIFSFCFDSAKAQEGELFSLVGDTVRRITEIANKYGVACDKPTLLTENYYKNSALSALERGLSVAEGEKYEEETSCVTVCEAETIYDEAEFAAREIRRLVREEGYSYNDFVIMARNEEQYRAAVTHMCSRYEVPCFTDKRYGVAYLPLSVFVCASMRAAAHFQTEDILKYLKTELAGLSLSEISQLENYAYIWKINGKAWLSDWTGSPSGFEKFDEEDHQSLIKINELRIKAVSPLIRFREEFIGTAGELSKAVWRLMERCSVSERLKALSAELERDEAELNRQGYNAVLDILDGLSHSLSDDMCEPSRFCEYFTLAVNSTTVGAIPQMLDEVTFGSADRIKPREPRVCFLLGMNRGIFPGSASAPGIIGTTERRTLLDAGMPITDYSLGFSIDEEYLVYVSLCCPSERLYMTYNIADGAQASGAVDRVQSILPNCKKIKYSLLSEADRIETAATGFTALMRQNEGELKSTLLDYFKDKHPYAERLSILEEQKEISLTSENGERLFGKDMRLSATGVDTYFRCAFSYFCRYGLSLRVIKPAEIDALQRGTLVHAALEKIVSEKLEFMTDEEIIAAVDKVIEEYLASIKGIEQIYDNRFKYILSSISELTVSVLMHLRDDFKQGGFKPLKCELKIGGSDADVEGAKIINGDGSITLRGAIDRVDKFGSYIRVVDYKTGTRKFRLPDVLYGLNMQMLLYLYAVMQSDKFKDLKPAGVLYLETRQIPDEEHSFRMNGIIAEDKEIHSAMDSENEGRFVARLRVKKDGSFYKSNDFIKSESFYDIFTHMEHMLKKMNRALCDGKIPVDPLDSLDKDACKYCDYGAVCGIENRAHRKVPSIPSDKLYECFKEGGINV